MYDRQALFNNRNCKALCKGNLAGQKLYPPPLLSATHHVCSTMGSAAKDGRKWGGVLSKLRAYQGMQRSTLPCLAGDHHWNWDTPGSGLSSRIHQSLPCPTFTGCSSSGGADLRKLRSLKFAPSLVSKSVSSRMDLVNGKSTRHSFWVIFLFPVVWAFCLWTI